MGKFEIKNKNEVKILKNKVGKILFVGSMRQIKRRLRKFIAPGPLPFLLWQSSQFGYTIEGINHNHNYNNNVEKLKEKLKRIPKDPGVYEFLDKDSSVIYIGKAKNLKLRVSQYFGKSDGRPQIPYLLAEIADINYTVVTNELESLFLENTLIKKHFPKYNINLRDDKNYAFIKIDYSFQIPQIQIVRKINTTRRHSGGAKATEKSHTRNIDPSLGLKSSLRMTPRDMYFGPYSAAYKIRHTLNLTRKIFPFCANKEVGTRPCFYYYLHRCPGVCIGKISLDEYKNQLEKISWFLSGNTSKVKSELKTEMKIAASKEQFEKAARLRDQLEALELLDERQNVILNKPVAWDVVSLAVDQGFACVNLFKIREGKMLDKENFVYEADFIRRHSDPERSEGEESQNPRKRSFSASADQDDVTKEILQTFLEQYYLETSSFPQTVYVQSQIEDPELIEHVIRSRFGKKAEVITPQKSKPLELVKLGKTNAEEYLKNWLQNQAGHLDKINKALEELKNVLNLEKIPERIEGFDISNIQGTNPVGSMVVFKQGLPQKSEYRKFKIQSKSVSGGPDDFAMMKEMLERRLNRLVIASEAKQSITEEKIAASRPFDKLKVVSGEPVEPQVGTRDDTKVWPHPDLIVIDGGKGQLNVALEVLKAISYKLEAIPIIGLAKRIEEIFLPGKPDPIILSHDNPALQLLQRLRDEAHRFGITLHRNLRSKQALKSALDNIPGIGPKTKKLLKDKFGTVANIRKASLDDLSTVVGERIAQLIQQSL